MKCNLAQEPFQFPVHEIETEKQFDLDMEPEDLGNDSDGLMLQ